VRATSPETMVAELKCGRKPSQDQSLSDGATPTPTPNPTRNRRSKR